MMRKYVLLSVVFLVLYIVSSIAVQYYRFQKTPPWKRLLHGLTEVEIVKSSPYSVAFQKDSNRISYDLMLADNWSKVEVDELLQFVDIPAIRDDQVVDGENFDIKLLEMWLKKDSVIMAISDRFMIGAPIDDDQQQILIDTLIAGIYQNDSLLYFSESAAAVSTSSLADTPGPIRDRILYIYTHPREFFGIKGVGVAENIKRQLKARGVFILEGETHQ